MTEKEIIERTQAKIIVNATAEIEGFYVGDFMSRVVSKAPAKSLWLTVMTNVNVAGVASLAEISAVLLCEGVTPDELLISKCKNEGIGLFSTDLNVFDASVRLAK
jgi:hypothetical protein